MSTTTVDWLLGQLLLGSWFDCIGLVIELVLVIKYFATFGWKDTWFLKYAVVVVTIVDIVAVIVVCEWVYIIAIKHFTELEYLGKQGVQLPIHNVLVSFTACVTQVYLACRFYRISKNITVFVSLLVISAGAYASAIYISVIQVKAAGSIDDRDLLIDAAYAWLSCEAVCDILVSSALIFYLVRIRERVQSEETKDMVKRFIFLAFESGVFTSIMAIATLLATSLKLDSNVCLLFVFVLGRVYGCTFLYNLIIRAKKVNLADLTPTALEKSRPVEELARTLPDLERDAANAQEGHVNASTEIEKK